MRGGWVLWILICVYAILGVAYAVRTPLWQAPDEPAHFNYVRSIAEGHGLPVLQPGDYDFDYLERLKAAKFPRELSIDALRYESHQPPLYYLLASPLYMASRQLPIEGLVLVLRLLSVFLGCLLLLLAYAVARRVFPNDGLIALSIAAFIALLPQHLAMSAAINNDTLVEVVISAILLLLVREVTPPRKSKVAQPVRTTLALGFLLGLALLTKTTAYTALIIIPVGLLLARSPRSQRGGWGIGKRLLLIGAVALVVAGWWFARNAAVYGPADPLGLRRHDLVVTGQPLTGTFDLATAWSFAAVTFKSFWAQFGWMGLPADERTYTLLGTLSAVAGLGLILFVARAVKERGALTPQQKSSLSLLGLALLLTLLGMLAYNLRFLQPQGRYLFPAILPIAVSFTLGLREFLSPRYAALAFTLVYAGLVLLNLIFLARLIPLLA